MPSDKHHALSLMSPWLLSAFSAVLYAFAYLVITYLYSALLADRKLLAGQWSAPASLVGTLLAACPLLTAPLGAFIAGR